jgi:hypothetical protein
MDLREFKNTFKYAKTPFSFRLEPSNKTYSVEEGLRARVKDPLWFLSRQWQMAEFRAENGGSLVRTEISCATKELNMLNVPKYPSQQLDLKSSLEAQVEAESPLPGTTKPPVARAWDSTKLCYSFSVSGSGTELNAAKYDGEYLDWYGFDLKNAGAFPAAQDLRVLKPTHLDYTGMPMARWWSIENQNIALGEVRRPYLNFLTMMLIEFGLVYSNDWYLIPVAQNIGNLRRINFLRVMDSFGVTSLVEPVIDTTPEKKGWEVFTLTPTQHNTLSDGRLLYMPNNLYHCLESEPVERVSLFRDEMANLVWGIEQIYKDPRSGKIVRGRDDENSKAPAPDAESPHYWDVKERKVVPKEDVQGEGEPGKRYIGPLDYYHGRTQLPLNWIPYVPVQIKTNNQATTGQIQLRRGKTIDRPGPQCKGVLLTESTLIREDEVPRLGIAVSRLVQVARRTDDVTVVWTGRRKRPDHRQASSGLMFDYLRPPHLSE